MRCAFLCGLVLFIFLGSVSSTIVARDDPTSSVLSEGEEGYVVEGTVRLAGLTLRTSNIKIVLDGGKLVTFPRLDGYFSFVGVPAGTHLLEVVALGAFFAPVRLDVSARLKGQVKAVFAEDRRQQLPDPLVLAPTRLEEYYEKREPLSLWKLMWTPAGMMVMFLLVVVVILPRLMDGIDPEEMQKMQEEMRRPPQGGLTSMLSGGK